MLHGCGMGEFVSGTDLTALEARFHVILCDLWGCVHDGVRVFPAAAGLLAQWRAQARIVILLSNAPRPAVVVREQLDRLGLDRDSYDAIVTSGDVGIAALMERGPTELGLIGTAADRAALEGTGLILRGGPDGDEVICTGLEEGARDAAHEDPVLEAMLARGARLHCFNPDRIVLRGGVPELCAGAIAERYEAMGGSVSWYGKPYRAVYDHCLALASRLAGRTVGASEVLAVGDALGTDFAGAARAGFAFLFVTRGIEAELVAAEGASALLQRFARKEGLALPKPLLFVPQLG